jgi:hypothetical protein
VLQELDDMRASHASRCGVMDGTVEHLLGERAARTRQHRVDLATLEQRRAAEVEGLLRAAAAAEALREGQAKKVQQDHQRVSDAASGADIQPWGQLTWELGGQRASQQSHPPGPSLVTGASPPAGADCQVDRV